MKNIKRLKVAYKEDVPSILETLNMKKQVEDGMVYCAQCGQTITLDNLGVIIPKSSGSIEIVCNTPECIEEQDWKERI